MGCNHTQSDDDKEGNNIRMNRIPLSSGQGHSQNAQDEEQFKDFEEIGSNLKKL